MIIGQRTKGGISECFVLYMYDTGGGPTIQNHRNNKGKW